MAVDLMVGNARDHLCILCFRGQLTISAPLMLLSLLSHQVRLFADFPTIRTYQDFSSNHYHRNLIHLI